MCVLQYFHRVSNKQLHNNFYFKIKELELNCFKFLGILEMKYWRLIVQVGWNFHKNWIFNTKTQKAWNKNGAKLQQN